MDSWHTPLLHPDGSGHWDRPFASGISLLLAAMLVGAIAGCNRPVASCAPRAGLSELRALRVDHAAAEALGAYRAGDHRLLGVYGYALEVPAFDGNPYADAGAVRVLAGTGDVYCTREERALNVNARAYARKYNEAMLAESAGHAD